MFLTRSQVLIAVAAVVCSGCSWSHGPNEEAMPPLRREPYMVVGEQTGTQFIIYTEGLRSRAEHSMGDSRYISVTDLAKGERLSWRPGAPSETLKRIPMRKAKPDTAFYWGGSKWAERGGACSAAGESGVLWRREIGRLATEEAACISSDGVILRVGSGAEVIMEVSKVVRGDVPDELFSAPQTERRG